MTAPAEKPEPAIMLRARLTRREWNAIRIRAIREGIENSELVARLIRKGLEANGR